MNSETGPTEKSTCCRHQKSITRIMHYSTYHTLPEKTIQSINQPTQNRKKESITKLQRHPMLSTIIQNSKRKQCDFEAASPKYRRGKDQRRRCDFSVQVYENIPPKPLGHAFRSFNPKT
jgi:hypothetical protein